MFGSNFFGNFGLPDMPQQGMDGALGAMPQMQALGQPAPQASPLAPPAAASPGGGMEQSPLGLGAMGPAAGPPPGENPTAPAAGISSPFQKPGMPNG